jgi:hypothetical protein
MTAHARARAPPRAPWWEVRTGTTEHEGSDANEQDHTTAR